LWGDVLLQLLLGAFFGFFTGNVLVRAGILFGGLVAAAGVVIQSYIVARYVASPRYTIFSAAKEFLLPLYPYVGQHVWFILVFFLANLPFAFAFLIGFMVGVASAIPGYEWS